MVTATKHRCVDPHDDVPECEDPDCGFVWPEADRFGGDVPEYDRYDRGWDLYDLWFGGNW